jgi:YesN/AraC family two-component response regulator
MEKNTKRKVVMFPSKPIEAMAQRLIDEKGYKNMQEVALEGIRKLHDASFPAYTQKLTAVKESKTPEQRAEDELTHKRLLQEKKREEAESICTQLNGTIQGNACHFKTYSKMYGKTIHEGAQAVPLEILTSDYIEKQYVNTTPKEVKEQFKSK